MTQINIFRLLFACVGLIIIANLGYAGELPTPNKLGGDFRFQSTLGEPLAISQLKGKVVLLNFGFTSCPHICPMVLSELTKVQKTLDDDAKKLQVIFVTVDPEHDSLEKLREYLAHFHPSFIGMRDNSADTVRAVMRRYGAALISDQKDISHTDYVYIIDRDGYVAGFYDIQSGYNELVSAINKIL